jgi:hypothetical protein
MITDLELKTGEVINSIQRKKKHILSESEGLRSKEIEFLTQL